MVGHCQRTDRLPRLRAIRSMRRIIQRASNVNTTVIATRISASTSGDGRAGDVRLAGEHELAHRVEPDRERDRRDRERAERAQPPDREVEPGHEVHGLDHELGHVERLAAPQQEQAGEDHPEAVQRGQGEGEHDDHEPPLLDVEGDAEDSGRDERIAAARVELITSPPTAIPSRIAIRFIGAAK